MTISDQLKQTRDAMAKWAQQNSGKVNVASDPYHLAYLIVQSPGAMRVCVMFHSETKRGEHEEAGLVDRTFWVVISRGQGMKVEPGASLVDGVGGGRGLFDLVEEARQVIRGIQFREETTEVTPNYLGCEPFSIEGWLTDAYRLEFSIGVQLEAPE